MNLHKWITSAGLMAAIVLTGCNATQARIDDNEELFATYSPNDQALIKSNRIDEGFDTTQVYLAFGNADRTELQDSGEVWYYHETHQDTVQEEKSATEYRLEVVDYEKAVAKGHKHLQEPKTYRTVRLYRTRVSRTVNFADGKVTSWEEPEDAWLDEWHQ